MKKNCVNIYNVCACESVVAFLEEMKNYTSIKINKFEVYLEFQINFFLLNTYKI